MLMSRVGQTHSDTQNTELVVGLSSHNFLLFIFQGRKVQGLFGLFSLFSFCRFCRFCLPFVRDGRGGHATARPLDTTRCSQIHSDLQLLTHGCNETTSGCNGNYFEVVYACVCVLRCSRSEGDGEDQRRERGRTCHPNIELGSDASWN